VETSNNNTNCWFCGTKMKWSDDSSFEDYGIDGKGIIAEVYCPSCGATADFYTKIEK